MNPGNDGLAGRHILLGVSGGIAAYKSPEIVRRLADRGALVQVVMTAGATQFVTALTLQAVSGRPVRGDLWDKSAEAAMGHIELARWAAQVIVAPATADLVARLAHGRADDLLATLCLATEAPIALAPAMNRLMWANPATRANCATLRDRGVDLLGPADGPQACGEVGPGRMLEPEAIVDWLAAHAGGGALAGLHVMVTAGPTREPIDPVRYLSNRSSGKMGFAVARAAAAEGARVTLVSGPVNLPTPRGSTRVEVETASQMHSAVLERIGDVDIFIGAAAVADYTPAAPAEQKIKRSAASRELSLNAAPDVLASVAAHPAPPFTVGFAAETENVEAYARGKLEGKGLDMIAANRVGNGLGFDSDDNELAVLWKGGGEMLARQAKATVAAALVSLIAARYDTTRGNPEREKRHA